MRYRTVIRGTMLRLCCCCVLIVWIIISGNTTLAAEYPTKPVQIIVPNPPGGGSDIVTRVVASKLPDHLGQAVVVVNKGGAGAAIGTYAALAAPADGYTVYNISPVSISAPLTQKGITYSILRDFVPINLTVTSPTLLVVKKDSPWGTLEELIGEAKKRPGQLTCGIGSFGSTNHFAAELLKKDAGIDFTIVPMVGTGPVVSAILGGHLNFVPIDLGTVRSYLEAGSLRALAVLSKKRFKDIPNIPTTVEKGYPEIIMDVFQGFGVRSDTPRVIVEKLERVFQETVRDAEITKTYEKTGWSVENLGVEKSIEFLTQDQKRKVETAKAINALPQKEEPKKK